ncbi:MAG: hypothetical protein IKC80_03850 [Kiritimatiellae bacterium]|nr:hypothetical protein [Kiritimatiellia bacterium]
MTLSAAEVVWKGGGETAAWSDGSNWEGGTAPGLGDIAVLPAGSDVIAGNADYAYMSAAETKLAGIRIEEGAWMSISNLTANVTHDIALSGSGGFRCIKASGNYSLTMKSDNSAFTGEFFVKEAGFKPSTTKYSLGASGNKVSYYGNSAAKWYFQYDITGCSNVVHLYKGTGGYLYYGPNGKTVYGPMYVHATSQIWGSGSTNFDFYNDVVYDGAAGGGLQIQVGVRMLGNGVLDLGSGFISANKNYDSNPALTIGRRVTRGEVRAGGGTVVLQGRDDCFDPGVKLTMNAASARVALSGGKNQRCGVLAEAAAVTSSAQITAPSPAMFTVCASGPAAMKTSLNGALSFCLNSTNAAEAGTLGIKTGGSMSGVLSSRRGTLSVQSAAQLPNVTGLTAENEGVLSVDGASLPKVSGIALSGTASINFTGASLPSVEKLTLGDTASLTADATTMLGDGTIHLEKSVASALELNCDLTVVDAKIGGNYLPAGKYTAADGYFTGAGELTVKWVPVEEVKTAQWIGAQGDGDLLNPDNWAGGVVPDLASGNTALTLGGGGAAASVNLTKEIYVHGITFKGDVATTLTATDVSARIRLGAGGIQSEKGSLASAANVIDVPIHFEYVPQQPWCISAGTSLDIKKPMTDTYFNEASQVIYGRGTIYLNADSPDLRCPLVLSNLWVKINKPYALGSPSRPSRMYVCGSGSNGDGEQIRFAKITNHVPVELYRLDNKNIIYLTAFGNKDGFLQAGKVTLLNTFYFNTLDGYRFSGGFDGSGTFYAIAYSYTIEGEPINSTSFHLYQDDSTLYLKSQNNVYGSITQAKKKTVCGADNVLCPTASFQFGRIGNSAGVDYSVGTLDLNGFDQDTGSLVNGGTITAQANTYRVGYIKSDARPATVTTHDATDRSVSLVFSGYAGYGHAGSGTYTFYNNPSATKGSLKVLAGGVKLGAGSGFPNVTNVTVGVGANLTVTPEAAATAFSNDDGVSRAMMEIAADGENSGTLTLEGGTTTVRKLRVGDKWFARGEYTAADVSWLKGEGVLRVLVAGRPMTMIVR